ncbi:MAG: hypothetical protein DRH57_05310 [Candidatus Cloacimonadota bacterium]|nr:MAG: hypothetical protein DRH57_05310 [Candidatus Cloacimonadota bacterium]
MEETEITMDETSEETISTGQDEDAGYIESDINSNTQEVKDDFEIPTDEEETFDFENMTDDQLDAVIKELDDIDEDETPEDKPEFELPDKFNNVDDLVKSYKMLEGKIGNFKGAPEAYELKGQDMDSPLISGLADTARELNMSNDAFGQFVEKYNDVQGQMDELYTRDEMAALGSHGETRIANINQFLDSSMNPHQAEILREMATSADSIGAIESLIQMARPSTPATTQQASFSAPSDQDIQKMMFATDDYGNLKMETDSQYATKVNELMNNTWG